MKKTLFIFLSFILFGVSLNAQSLSSHKEDYERFRKEQSNDYEKYRNQAKKDFNDFRDSINADYTRFMKQRWEWYKSEKAIPAPKPKPLPPVVKPEEEINKIPQDNPIIFEELVITCPPVRPPCPMQVEPVPEDVDKPQIEAKEFVFYFYGTLCKVRLNKNYVLHLKNTNEEAVADFWNELSSKSYNNLIIDCLKLKKELNLCDWAYFKMLEQLSHSFIGKHNEATILHAFLFAQSGYKVLIARGDSGDLQLLPATDATLYGIRYYSIDGEKFYQLKDDEKNGLHIYKKMYPQATTMSMKINREQDFSADNMKEQTLSSSKSISLNISCSRRLIDFYNDYPKTSYDIYANTPLSNSIKKDLYPILQKAIQGKSEEESANILIHFVQTAFIYKTDFEAWGVPDRIFFADETLVYPYSDCEDRSILFSRIVRDLMGLDVVLVNYPHHLATAVCFNENIKGDYLTVEGKRYLICDPTYINACIGETMPMYINCDSIKIIALKNRQ